MEKDTETKTATKSVHNIRLYHTYENLLTWFNFSEISFVIASSFTPDQDKKKEKQHLLNAEKNSCI